ncbi:MAG: FAD-binding oxidoreductase [Anaerolineae bacterium]|nr:FAD-binding oxidoreductase [Anaerolineae bacterium]
MTVSFWQAEGTQPVREVDFLVVGAGLVGCATAYLAQQAGHTVVITERADIAQGASGRNAGFMITGLDAYYHRAVDKYGAAVAREMWDISTQTITFWRERIRQAGGAVRQVDCGSLLLAESPAEAREIETAARALEAAGIAMHYHSRDPLGRGFYNAIENPGDGAVQPVELAQAVFQQSGAELIAGNELYHLEQTTPEIVTVFTRRYIFKAHYVMLCTNAWSALVDPFFEGKVIPTRGQVLVTEPLPAPILTTCGYSDYGYMYYRSTFDNRLLLGGGRNRHFETENGTTDDRITGGVQRTLDDYLLARFPELRGVAIARRWAGIMGFSVDGLPLAGVLPDKPRVGFAVGFTGHGLSLGAGTAERALHRLLHGTSAGAVDARRLL